MKVVVAIDQVNWKEVVEAVVKQPWSDETSFKLLTVLESLEWSESYPSQFSVVMKDIENKRRQRADEILKEAREIFLARRPENSVHTELRTGSPRCEIVDAASQWMADKVVLGAHGQSPNRLFPGTVSRAVAEHADCSVELVRLKGAEIKLRV